MTLRNLGMMKKLSLIALAVAAMLASAPAHALTIDFSFTGETTGPVGCCVAPIPPYTGTVTGEIVGLVDGAADQTPTAIYLTSYTSVTGLAESNWPTPTTNILAYTPGAGFDLDGLNTFTVNAAGLLTGVHFAISITTSQVSLFNLSLYIDTTIPADSVFSLYNDGTDTGISTDLATFTPVSTTPLPAALPLFATGLGGLRLLGWRRKRKNAALIAAA